MNRLMGLVGRGRSAIKPTIHSVRKVLKTQFISAGISPGAAETSSNLLIAHVLGEKTLYKVHPSRRLNLGLLHQVTELSERVIKREPLQYVLGEWDVGELTLDMRPPVFIPRPETEELINFVSDDIINKSGTEIKLLEIGVGSGAISVNLLHRHPHLRAVAIDKSEAACQLSHDNSERYGVCHRLDIRQLTVNDSRRWVESVRGGGPFDVIVSNPPYVPTEEIESLQPEILEYEDLDALDGGERGMQIIETILHSAASLLSRQGSLWLEVGLGQPAAVESYVQSRECGVKFVQAHRDFTDRPRFCHLTTFDPV